MVLGDWPTEQAQRQAAIDHLAPLGYTRALIPDGDEIIETALLQTLLTIADNDLADRVYVHRDTYWKTPEYVIRPRERFAPCYLIEPRVAKLGSGGCFTEGTPVQMAYDTTKPIEQIKEGDMVMSRDEQLAPRRQSRSQASAAGYHLRVGHTVLLKRRRARCGRPPRTTRSSCTARAG